MCLQPSPTYVTLPPNVRPIYGRLAWLDELRLLAILVMVLDHTLLFFGQEIPGANVVRLTLTRCAEPLFVVVLTFLTIYLGRPMKASRWLQIALVSVATSAILSHHLGYAVADILVSIALAALALPSLLELPQRWIVTLLYATAALSCVPIEVAGMGFDYSPVLLIYQILLTLLLSRRGMASACTHGALSGLVLVFASFGISRLGVAANASLIVVMCGHPLAALVVHAIRRQEQHCSTPLTRMAKRPLTLYAVHLCVFAWIANVLRLAV
ncbi:TraX family protein [Verrucomicrobiales bacterium]|nr:TraX family protein [Verrucomicrobiales bacterium]